MCLCGAAGRSAPAARWPAPRVSCLWPDVSLSGPRPLEANLVGVEELFPRQFLILLHLWVY